MTHLGIRYARPREGNSLLANRRCGSEDDEAQVSRDSAKTERDRLRGDGGLDRASALLRSSDASLGGLERQYEHSALLKLFAFISIR